MHVHGIIDSLTYPDSPSFLRYQYPSRLPQDVQQRLTDSAARVIEGFGLTNSTFNIEYFWDADTDRLSLLEVNPRHSQSHAWLFQQVDGVANHQLMLRLALGQPAALPDHKGPHAVAGKYFLRHFTDGLVTHAPTPERVAAVERDLTGVHVQPVAREGQRLSDLPQQDSYSFELAEINIGAETEHELEQKYEQCVERLGYAVDERSPQ